MANFVKWHLLALITFTMSPLLKTHHSQTETLTIKQ